MAGILFLVIIGLGFAAYALGYHNGHADGEGTGYVQGKTAGIQTWQRVLESKRLDSRAEIVAVRVPSQRTRLYDWKTEGL